MDCGVIDKEICEVAQGAVWFESEMLVVRVKDGGRIEGWGGESDGRSQP